MTEFDGLYKELVDIVTNLGNIAVAKDFEGDTANAVRQKAVKFLQQAQVAATDLQVLDTALDGYRKSVRAYVNTDNLPAQFDDMDNIWYHAQKPHIDPRKKVIDMTFDNGHVTSITTPQKTDSGATDLLALKKGVDPAFATKMHNKYWKAAEDLDHGMEPHSEAVRTMPTITSVEDGTYKGSGNLGVSIFEKLNGSFKESDFDNDSPYSKLKYKGNSDYLNSLAAHHEENKQKAENKKEDTKKDTNKANNNNAAPRTSAAPMTARTASAGPRTGATPSSGGGGSPKLGWDLKKVSADDIYDQLRSKFGVPEDKVSDKQLKDYIEGNGYEVKDFTSGKKDLDELTDYSSPDFATKTDTTTSSDNYTPPDFDSYTPSSFDPGDYDSGTDPVDFHSSDLGTDTSAATTTPYTPSSFSSSAPSSAGRTIPTGQFNSMMDRLNDPIYTRGTPGAAGAPGAAGQSRGGTTVGGGGGAAATGKPAAMGPTSGTGGSSATSNRGLKSGSAVPASGSMGGRGMGMMPMMGGMGAPGAGSGRGSNDKEKAKIKNQDGDLYGNDVNTVAPVISAGSRPAGLGSNNTKENK